MTGAGILASNGAIRCGSGLVTLAVPGKLAGKYRKLLMEVMQAGVGKGERHGSGDAGALLKIAERKGAVVFGPGVGRDDDTRELLGVLLSRLKLP